MMQHISSLLLYSLTFALSIAIACNFENFRRRSFNDSSFDFRITLIVRRIAVVMPVVILLALRGPEVGWDTQNNLISFERSAQLTLDEEMELSRAPLFTILQSILSFIFPNSSEAYFGICALITLYVMLVAIEKWSDSISIPFALFSFYCLLGLLMADQMRQMMAVSWVAYACCMIKQFQRKRAILASIIAVGLHVSSLIVILAFAFTWLFRNRSVKNAVIVLMSFVVVACILPGVINQFSDLLTSAFGEYSASYYEGNVQAWGGGLLLVVVAYWVPLAIAMQELKSNREDMPWAIWSSFSVPVRAIGYYSFFLNRIYYYFAVLQPLVLASLPLSNVKRTLVALMYICFYLVQFYYLNTYNVFPYIPSFT